MVGSWPLEGDELNFLYGCPRAQHLNPGITPREDDLLAFCVKEAGGRSHRVFSPGAFLVLPSQKEFCITAANDLDIDTGSPVPAVLMRGILDHHIGHRNLLTALPVTVRRTIDIPQILLLPAENS